MEVLNEKSQLLNEMARFRGFGIAIEVRSHDHGKIGNKSSPAHVHILDSSDKEIAEIVLTIKPPQKSSDIEWYRTPNPPVGLADKIVKLAKTENKAMKKIGVVETLWQSILRVWVTFREN